jgi:hypothetical protein
MIDKINLGTNHSSLHFFSTLGCVVRFIYDDVVVLKLGAIRFYQDWFVPIMKDFDTIYLFKIEHFIIFIILAVCSLQFAKQYAIRKQQGTRNNQQVIRKKEQTLRVRLGFGSILCASHMLRIRKRIRIRTKPCERNGITKAFHVNRIKKD